MTEPRPPAALRKLQIIFKVTAEEREELRRGALLARAPFSVWARSTLLREAERLRREGRPPPEPRR